MILLFLAKNSQKQPILKISEIAKNNNNKNKNNNNKQIIKNYNKMHSANKVKLATQKRQAFVSLLI